MVFSPFGVAKSFSIPGAATSPDSPSGELALVMLNFAHIQLPEQGIQQDQEIKLADDTPNQSPGSMAEKNRTLVVRGQGLYKGRSVIVFSYTGELFENWDSKNQKIGDAEGFTLLDQMTGVPLYAEKTKTFEAPEEGQPGRKIATRGHTAYLVNF